MQKYIMEFIGTFFLVLAIGCAVIEPGSGALAPLAIGCALMVLVYAGGHISGAHYNPAVTIAILVRGKCELKDAIVYIVVQLLGAVAAAYVVGILKGGVPVIAGSIDPTNAFIAEVLFTFLLVFVILNVATSKKTEGNSYYGLAIGFTVAAGAFAVGGISGAAFNPAVVVGATVMGLMKTGSIGLFFAANIIGGVAAALTFKALNPDD